MMYQAALRHFHETMLATSCKEMQRSCVNCMGEKMMYMGWLEYCCKLLTYTRACRQ